MRLESIRTAGPHGMLCSFTMKAPSSPLPSVTPSRRFPDSLAGWLTGTQMLRHDTTRHNGRRAYNALPCPVRPSVRPSVQRALLGPHARTPPSRETPDRDR